MKPGHALFLHVLQLIAILGAAVEYFYTEPVAEFLGVEYYQFEGDRYAIFTQKATWEEATQLCGTKNGSLVEFESPELAEFIAQALAESAAGFGALWINGKLVKTDQNGTVGEWMWYSKKTAIDVSASPSYPMNVTPFWVDKPPTESTKDLCLGTDRRLHHLPLIVPIECRQERPYICKLPPDGSDGKPTEVKPPVETSTKRFHIFQGAVTWAEALAECHNLGFKLAKIISADDFTKIGHKMLRIRPVMENAWIGGSYRGDKWTWVSTDEAILTDQGNSTDLEKFAWYRPNDIIPEGCLLADRHVCDHFVYVEAKCDRRRPFICEEVVINEPKRPLIPVGPGIWISSYNETWEKARIACGECLNGSLIKIPADKDKVTKVLPNLYQAMALTIGIEVRHVWIGGYLFGTNFKWAGDSKSEPEGDALTLDATKYTEELYGIGEQGMLIYCNANLSIETYLLKYKCLNMDRENQKNFFMYGLNCDLKQYFICETEESVTEMLDCESEKGLLPPGFRTSTPKYDQRPAKPQ